LISASIRNTFSQENVHCVFGKRQMF